MKKSLLILVLLSLAVFLCVSTAYSDDWKVPDKWKYLRFAGGSAAGSWTPLTAKICELIDRHIPGVRSSSTTGASYGNLVVVNRGTMQMAMSMSNAVHESYYGIDVRGTGTLQQTPDIRYIGSMHFGVINSFVPKKSPLKELSEIGKKPIRMTCGPKKSFAYFFDNLMLNMYGSSIEDLEKRGGTAHKVYEGQGLALMKDGKIDLLVFHAGPPTAVVMDAASSIGIRFLEFDPETKKKLMNKLKGSVAVTIPKNMYPGIEKDFHTFGFYFPIVVNKEMPEELGYRITKVIWDNLDQLQKIGAFAKNIKWETALKGATIPLHPGAERYYREKGVAIPPLPK